MLNGNGSYTQNDVTLPLARGNLIIVNAYTPHIEKLTADCPLDVLYFAVDTAAFKTFHTATLDEMLRSAADKSPYEKPIFYPATDLLPLFSESAKLFEEEIETKQPYFEALCQARFQVLLIAIMRLTALHPSGNTAAPTKNARISTAVAQYLKDTLAVEHSLEELSERFFISKNHLSILFKQQFGMTPIKYLQKLRIDEARTLLAETDHSVSEIASHTGFINASYFARVYKQWTGHTPSEVRVPNPKDNTR